jgi:GNAT superfamily N-acetyltransferase
MNEQSGGSLTISEAKEEEDLDSIVAAYEWLFAPPGRKPSTWEENRAKQSLRRLVSATSTTVLVAKRNLKLVGFCTIYMDIESVRYGRRAWVEDLAVHPEFRSQGIGKRLLDAAKEWGKSKGATHLTLESGVRRVNAHRFYERENPTTMARSFNWEL